MAPSSKKPSAKKAAATAKKSADRKVRPVRSTGEHESPEFEVGAGGETHQTRGRWRRG